MTMMMLLQAALKIAPKAANRLAVGNGEKVRVASMTVRKVRYYRSCLL